MTRWMAKPASVLEAPPTGRRRPRSRRPAGGNGPRARQLPVPAGPTRGGERRGTGTRTPTPHGDGLGDRAEERRWWRTRRRAADGASAAGSQGHLGAPKVSAVSSRPPAAGAASRRQARRATIITRVRGLIRSRSSSSSSAGLAPTSWTRLSRPVSWRSRRQSAPSRRVSRQGQRLEEGQRRRRRHRARARRPPRRPRVLAGESDTSTRSSATSRASPVGRGDSAESKSISQTVAHPRRGRPRCRARGCSGRCGPGAGSGHLRPQVSEEVVGRVAALEPGQLRSLHAPWRRTPSHRGGAER